MQKATLIIVISLMGIFAIKANAQTAPDAKQKKQHFYLKAGLGYAFAQSGQTGYSGSYQSSTGSSSSSATFDFKTASLSAGFNGTVGAGYMFNDHLGVELDAHIGIANKKYSYNETSIDSSGPGTPYSSTYNRSVHAQLPVLLIPAIVVQSGGKANVYARIGLVLPVKNKIIADQETTSYSGVDVRTEEYTTMFTIGYTGAIGLKYGLSKHVQLWGEISILSFAPYLKEGIATKSTVNGVDNLSTLPEQEKKIEYMFSGTTTSNNLSQNNPDIGATQSMPYSNIGIMMGLSFDL